MGGIFMAWKSHRNTAFYAQEYPCCGTGGQAALARGVALQNNMNALNLQEAQSLADLEQQRADNTVWYDTAIAQDNPPAQRAGGVKLCLQKFRC